MGQAVFPALAGQSWSVTRSPVWNTLVQTTASGMETRAVYSRAPRYRYALKFDVLRQTVGYAELETLLGFFNARQGRFDSFLFTDPTDCAAASAGFGTGTGAQHAFQLTRTLGGFAEPVFDLNLTYGAPTIAVNGVVKTPGTDYTIAQGLVTFTTPPAAGAALTWTGTYYWRVRFDQDTADFENFVHQLWTLGKLTLLGVRGPVGGAP